MAGGSQLCFGRGELLEPLPSVDEPLAVLLVKDPGVSVSTPWAYRRCRELQGDRYLQGEDSFEQRRQVLRGMAWTQPIRAAEPPPLRNDLQSVVAPETPAVQAALRLLSSLEGTLAVAMSGSGPSCFALFADPASCAAAQTKLDHQLAAEGLRSWCCRLQPHGIRVEA